MLPRRSLNEDETLPMHDGDRRVEKKSAGKKRFINLRCFVLTSGVLMCAQFALSIYTKSVLTSIERKFQISSSLAGFIVGSFNLGNMLFVVLVSKLSSDGNRPRIMAIGSMVVAVGGFTNVIPHFASSKYDPSLLVSSAAESNGSTSNQTLSVETTELPCEESTKLHVFLVIGEMLQGIGATVLIPLGSSYVDDFAKPGKSPLYLGIMFLLQNLGPGVGYLVGSLTATLYVDFDRVDADEIVVKMDEEAWVGAWWLGYIILSLCVILCAIPLLWFPRKLDENPAVEKKTFNQSNSVEDVKKHIGNDDVIPLNETTDNRNSEGAYPPKECLAKTSPASCAWVMNIFKDVYCTIKRLLTNPVYMLVVMGYSAAMFIVSTLTTFMPKFLEVVFYQSKSKASLIFGLSVPVVICVGLFSGGFIVQRLKLQTKGTLFFIAGVSATTALLCIPAYFVTCDAALNAVECLNRDVGFTGNTSLCADSRGEICAPYCYAFVAVLCLASLLCCHIITPSYSVILRTVNQKDKCTAIGLKFLIIRLIAFIPSPMITGAVIDDTCAKWSTSTSCIGTATCLEHKRETFRYSYMHIIFVGTIFTFLFNLAAYFVQRRIKSSSPSLDNAV